MKVCRYIAALYVPYQPRRYFVIEVPDSAPDYALQVHALRKFEYKEDRYAFGSVTAHAKTIRGEMHHTRMYTYADVARHIEAAMTIGVERECDSAWDFFAAIGYDHEAGRYKR